MCNPCPNGVTVSEDTVTEISGLTCGALKVMRVPANDALCLQKGPIAAETCCPTQSSETESKDLSIDSDIADIIIGNTTNTTNGTESIQQLETSSAVSLKIAGKIVLAVIWIAFLS